MKTLLLASCLFAAAGFTQISAEDKEVTVTLETVDEESPAAVAAAEVAGAADAARDIAAGKLQILRYGLAPPARPGPIQDRDEETGYIIYDTNQCVPTSAFLAHVHAYNDAMRKWHAAHKK